MTARAGKDLISCLVSGLLTIGPRFGGAIDDAARYFKGAADEVRGGGTVPQGVFVSWYCRPRCFVEGVPQAVPQSMPPKD